MLRLHPVEKGVVGDGFVQSFHKGFLISANRCRSLIHLHRQYGWSLRSTLPQPWQLLAVSCRLALMLTSSLGPSPLARGIQKQVLSCQLRWSYWTVRVVK